MSPETASSLRYLYVSTKPLKLINSTSLSEIIAVFFKYWTNIVLFLFLTDDIVLWGVGSVDANEDQVKV
jgi:hypothetical protein